MSDERYPGEYPVIATDPSGYTSIEVPFSVVPKLQPGGAIVVPPDSFLIDGTQSWQFAPRVLSIGLRAGNDTDQPANVPIPIVGEIPIEVRGLYRGGGGTWLRRFVVPNLRRIELDISSFRDIRVQVHGTSTAEGCALYGTVSNRIPAYGARRETVYWPEQYAVAGDYLAPPGGLSFVAGAVDPGFAWIANLAATGVPVAFGVPLAPGVAFDARAGRFRTTVAGLSLLWRILV